MTQDCSPPRQLQLQAMGQTKASPRVVRTLRYYSLVVFCVVLVFFNLSVLFCCPMDSSVLWTPQCYVLSSGPFGNVVFTTFSLMDLSARQVFVYYVLSSGPFQLYCVLSSGPFSTGSPSRGGDVAVYVCDINQPSLPTPFYSGLVSVSVLMVLSTVFHSMNSPDNSQFSHSVLPVLFLPYWPF